MEQCYGIVTSADSLNLGNRCSIMLDNPDNVYCRYHGKQRNNKLYVVKIVKDLLDQCEKACGKDNKRAICEKIFKFLSQNIEFIKEHKKFADTLVKKLDELRSDMDRAIYWKQKIFPELFNNDVVVYTDVTKKFETTDINI